MSLKELLAAGADEFSSRFDVKKRKVLLMGGAGYIGLAIADKLLAEGYDVIIADNFIYGHEETYNNFGNKEKLKFVKYDFRDPLFPSLTEGVTDVVILAGLVGDPITKKYPDLSNQINGDSIRNFICELKKFKLNKVIFISTCSNYGLIAEDQLADEQFHLSPLSLYAEEKVRNEDFILNLDADDYTFSPMVLRFATAFGCAPRMRFDLTVNEFVLNIYLAQELEVYDPDTWRPYCHVKDFGNLIYIALSVPRECTDHQVFNAGGAKNNHTKRSLINIIGQNLDISKVKFVEGGNDPRNYRVDFKKVEEVLKFTPQWDVERGVEEIIKKLKSNSYDDWNSNKNFYGNYIIDEKFF